MTTPTLKPCPICRYPAVLREDTREEWPSVHCASCSFEMFATTKAKAAGLWNAVPRQEDLDKRDATIKRLSAALTRSRRLVRRLRDWIRDNRKA